MKMRRIFAGMSALAMAAMMAISASAAETTVSLDSLEVKGDLLGKTESWGLSGNNATVSFVDAIKSKLNLDDEGYYDWLKTVKNIKCTVEVTDVTPLTDGAFTGLYIQNNGGDWKWYSPSETGEAKFDAVGSFDLSWDINQADFSFYYPENDWESVPTMGVQLGSAGIKNDGDTGSVAGTVKNIVITYDDGKAAETPKTDDPKTEEPTNTNPPAGAAAGIALAGIAVAGAALVATKRK